MPPDEDLSSPPAASFYVQGSSASTFRSTLATQSPWDPASQHGGPPTALLAHCIERAVDDDTLRVGRLSTDFLQRIPQGECEVEVDVLRPGRRVQLVQAAMVVDGRTVVVARAWLVGWATGRAPVADHHRPPVPVPEPRAQRFFEGLDPAWGYGRAIEWRFVSGGYDRSGPAQVWARPRVPLLPGEPTSGLQRLLVVADSTNGLSAPLAFDQWLFVPPGLTVTLQRPPTGEWVYLDACTDVDEGGTGIAHARLADESGFVGFATQPLLVAPR